MVSPASRIMPPIVKGIHRVVARNGKNALTVSHHDMFALAQNTETRLLQSAYRLKVGNSGNFAH